MSAAGKTASRVPTIYVLAGCNGAGKSSVGGAAFEHAGGLYYNPDDAARRIAAASGVERDASALTQAQINAAAWSEGRRLLERAIEERLDFAFETTLGGHTMTTLLERAAQSGIAVKMWFIGLASVEMHVRRVRQRAAKGGHDIPEALVRERFRHGRENLIRLLPRLAALRVFDNSAEASFAHGVPPSPRLLLDCDERRIVAPANLRALMTHTPPWAKPIVAAALKEHLRARRPSR